MDIDSGSDVWGAGEYKTKEEVDAADSESSNLAALGYSAGREVDTSEGATESGTSLLKSVLFKIGVTLLSFLVLCLLLFLILG
ncbi:hypothetical protein SAMN04487950_3837 [Halogranum rubrum]|uniref:Uncharacterized protein n=1 Tax=Halogranum rubrum TaxID=553466 RepID=A0A1I4HTU7_9EURY|nr:hypothetical protein SAMN04487950_3837 [Halogranum rubrum]